MIKNYISEISLNVSVGRFIKLSFLFSLIYFIIELLFSIAMIFWRPRIFFTNIEISYILLASFIPIILFVFSFYIYENYYFLKKTNYLLRIKSLIWIFYLTIPDLILLFRFTDFVQNNKIFTIIPIIGTTLFWLLGGNWDSNEVIKSIRVFKDVKYIMHKFWINQDPLFEKNHFEVDIIVNEREPFYTDKTGIEKFQKTISCPKIDVDAVFKLPMFKALSGNISVLDIGGADGEFSFNLLSKYKSNGHGNDISKIQYIDPVNFFHEYKDKFKGLIDESNLFNQQIPYEKWAPTCPEKYSLIIASHSLYSAIDNKKSSISTLMKKLNNNRAKNGVILIILASREGRAYSFKKHALKIIFGDDRYDVDSNLFKEDLIENYQSVVVDNYIDLTEYLNEFDDHKPENLIKWISYFLRVDTKNLAGQNLSRVIKLLKYYLQPLHELSDSDIQAFTNYNYPKPLDKNKSKVLSHKTEIILL